MGEEAIGRPDLQRRDLLIGIGNPLRGDDGVGPALLEELAEELGAWSTHGAELMAVHQLTPELALAVAVSRRVLFLDAWVSSGPGVPGMQPLPSLDPGVSGGGDHGHSHLGSHLLDPPHLLALAHSLYGWQGEAALLRVPAFRFPHGPGFSTPLQEGLPRARRMLRRWLREDDQGPTASRHG